MPSALPVGLFLLLLLFLAADAHGGHRAGLEALDRDLLFADLADPEGPVLDARHGVIDLLEQELLAVAQAEHHALRVLGRSEVDLVRKVLRTVISLAAKAEVDRLLLVSDVPLSAEHLRGRSLKKKLVYAVSEDRLAQALRRQGYVCVTVPPYDYSRVEKVKVALVAAMTANVLVDGENVLCLTGRSGARMPDTLIRLQIGRGFEEKAAIDTIGLGAEFNPQVVEALVSLAMAIGHEGFEGHPIGTIFVLGDSTVVMEQSKQLTINPFQGIS